MKPGASLAKDAVTSAITSNGWGVKSFNDGVGEQITVHLFKVTGTRAADHAALAKRLQGELKGATEVVIDSDGFAAVVVGKDAAVSEQSLAALLKGAGEGYGVSGFETKKWPKSVASYDVSVAGMTGEAEAAKVRECLQKLPKVIAVHVFRDTKSARIRLNEPCDKIAGVVTEALKGKGFEAKVGAVAAAKPESSGGSR